MSDNEKVIDNEEVVGNDVTYEEVMKHIQFDSDAEHMSNYVTGAESILGQLLKNDIVAFSGCERYTLGVLMANGMKFSEHNGSEGFLDSIRDKIAEMGRNLHQSAKDLVSSEKDDGGSKLKDVKLTELNKILDLLQSERVIGERVLFSILEDSEKQAAHYGSKTNDKDIRYRNWCTIISRVASDCPPHFLKKYPLVKQNSQTDPFVHFVEKAKRTEIPGLDKFKEEMTTLQDSIEEGWNKEKIVSLATEYLDFAEENKIKLLPGFNVVLTKSMIRGINQPGSDPHYDLWKLYEANVKNCKIVASFQPKNELDLNNLQATITACKLLGKLLGAVTKGNSHRNKVHIPIDVLIGSYKLKLARAICRNEFK